MLSNFIINQCIFFDTQIKVMSMYDSVDCILKSSKKLLVDDTTRTTRRPGDTTWYIDKNMCTCALLKLVT